MVNPDILRWARETAGLAPQEAARKLGIGDAHGLTGVERLNQLERGELSPTSRWLENAAKHYRRSLLIFYLPEIPRPGDRGEDFRTLPEPLRRRDVAIADAVLRDIRVRQELVRDAMESADDALELPFVNSMPGERVGTVVAESICNTLQFDRAEFRRRRNRRRAFDYLRGLAEEQGIFVLLIKNLGSWHTTVDVRLFRGFALADSIAPFVAINGNDSHGAQSFTLAHELAHIWTGASGVSGSPSGSGIEAFCNEVAAELLLPVAEMTILETIDRAPFGKAMEGISEFAAARNVSSTMVAYRLFRAGAIDRRRYRKLEETYRQLYLDRKKGRKDRAAGSRGGPDYYRTTRYNAGMSLVRLVERMMPDGNLSPTKAGMVLGIRPVKVHTLIEHEKPEYQRQHNR